jgi:hypothetical protein
MKLHGAVDRWFVPVVFAVHAAITLVVTLAHEAWFDEADVWLLMRDGGLRTLFGQTSNMGTPALWYLAVWPFAASGMPYVSQQLLNLAFEWIAMLLFLLFAPLPRWFKVLFALSYYASFEYAAIARPYALLMLLLFATAGCWKERNERPLRLAILIALLANVSAHGLMIASMAGFVLLLEWVDSRAVTRVPVAVALTVMSAGGLASLAQIWPRRGGQMLLNYRVEASTVEYVLSEAFFYGSRPGPGLWMSVIVLVAAILSLGRHAMSLILFCGTTLQLLFLFTFVWTGGARHAGLLLLVLVASLWIADSYGPPLGLRRVMHRIAVVGCGAGLAWGLLGAGSAWAAEIRYPFSGSRAMAAYIRQHGLADVDTAAHPWGSTGSVLVYLPGKRFWYATRGDWGSHGMWGSASRPRDLTIDEVLIAARARFRGRKWLLLTAGELRGASERGFRLRYHTEGPIWGRKDESFWIYEPLDTPLAPAGGSR